jgi:hypothetical protein
MSTNNNENFNDHCRPEWQPQRNNAKTTTFSRNDNNTVYILRNNRRPKKIILVVVVVVVCIMSCNMWPLSVQHVNSFSLSVFAFTNTRFDENSAWIPLLKKHAVLQGIRSPTTSVSLNRRSFDSSTSRRILSNNHLDKTMQQRQLLFMVASKQQQQQEQQDIKVTITTLISAITDYELLSNTGLDTTTTRKAKTDTSTDTSTMMITFPEYCHRPLGCTIEESLATNGVVFVTKIASGSFAESAGLQVGDIIVGTTSQFGQLESVLGNGIDTVYVFVDNIY